ncbi:MauE/DoxX family redox-associated membrane protein [Chryseobacterium sp.]|uniref:MauE/DoxX family redox-associated membrane protein n=1 Tax=Chryseobacterium sp. TaxID=1871047 RepID=UPI00289A8AB1|nr:MauE/DoxX family redox-associated membrane protein [Chryseobacterium sp.]
MKKLISSIPKVASYFFILLFCYASISKALDFENFQVQIGQSPLLSAYAGFVSYAVIILELLIVVLLAIPKTNLIGLYSSTALMSAFTVYIYLILNYSDFVPCSCGGILEKLGWMEHLIFNVVNVVLGFIGIYFRTKAEGNSFKKATILLLGSNILSGTFVITLFLQSEHVIKKENNFTRRFLPFPVIEDKVFTLKNNHYYFAGADFSNIYLGNRNYSGLISSIDGKFQKLSITKIIPSQTNFVFKNLQLNIQYPYYFLSDGTVPVIYRGRIGNPDAKIISYKDAFFSQLCPLDSVNFAIRTINNKNNQLTLGLLNVSKEAKSKVVLNSGLLKKQLDGVFDSDGKLISSKSPDRLIYTYSYRNEFLVMDKFLNLSNSFNTIDTTRTAQIKSKKLEEGHHKMIEPPLTVNQNIAAHRNLLFVHSKLKGRFESSTQWKKSSVIDIYSTNKKEYYGSFYIDKRKNDALRDYIITDNYFYALIGNYLIRYKYNSSLQEKLQGKPKT